MLISPKFSGFEELEGSDGRLIWGKRARKLYRPKIIPGSEELLDKHLNGSKKQFFAHLAPPSSPFSDVLTFPGTKINVVNTSAPLIGGRLSAEKLAKRSIYANQRSQTNLIEAELALGWWIVRTGGGADVGHKISEHIPVYGIDSVLAGLAIRGALLIPEAAAGEARRQAKDVDAINNFQNFIELPGAKGAEPKSAPAPTESLVMNEAR